MEYQLDHFNSEDYFDFIAFQQFSYPLHFHQLIEVVYVIEGELEVLQIDETIYLSAGEAVFFLSNELHGYNCSKNCRYYAFIFSPNWISSFLNTVINLFPQSPKFSFKELLSVNKQDLDTFFENPFKIRGFLLMLCGYFYEQAIWTHTPKQSDGLLTKVIHWIGQHYLEDISLADTAFALGYDSFYLSHFISDNLGTTFKKYVNGLRLAHSLDLFQTTQLPIATVAIHSGFPTVRTFNNQFKKAFQTTPRAYIAEKINK